MEKETDSLNEAEGKPDYDWPQEKAYSGIKKKFEKWMKTNLLKCPPKNFEKGRKIVQGIREAGL